MCIWERIDRKMNDNINIVNWSLTQAQRQCNGVKTVFSKTACLDILWAHTMDTCTDHTTLWFFSVVETGSPGSGCQRGQMSALFRVADFMFNPHTTEADGISFMNALIPFRTDPASWPNHLPKTSHHKITTLGNIISTHWLEEAHKHSDYSKGFWK